MCPRSDSDRIRSVLETLTRLAGGDYSLEPEANDGEKDETDRLRQTLEGLVHHLRERQSEQDYLRFTVDQAPDAVFWLARDGGFSYVNEQACRSLGHARDELLRLRIWDIDPEFSEERWSRQWERVSRTGNVRFETRHQRKDGVTFPVEISASFVQLGERGHHVAFARDISERKLAAEERAQLAAQLQHAQKMESVGRLAGGVAHDFNNLLSVVLSYSSILLSELAPTAPGRAELEEMKRAAERAATLTRQLLAFSRQQVLDFRILDLNEIVRDVGTLLRRVAGEDIELNLNLARRLGSIRADRGQLEQVLMNLAVNARDAMPKGGRLTIETANVDIDEEYARSHVDASAGPHVMLAVSDTGVGMDRGIQARAFEPFFTTKEHGKGTGLGLSTVFGIVKQSDGNIWLYSEPGKGTTFRIYFPRCDETEPRHLTNSIRARPAAGHETILLVEDEEQVRQLAARILRDAGYHVIPTSDGDEASNVSATYARPIDLLLTDVVLPGINGRALSERIRGSRPDIRVAFMSGYTGDVVMHHGVIDEASTFIQKPLTPEVLTRAVRDALDRA